MPAEMFVLSPACMDLSVLHHREFTSNPLTLLFLVRHMFSMTSRVAAGPMCVGLSAMACQTDQVQQGPTMGSLSAAKQKKKVRRLEPIAFQIHTEVKMQKVFQVMRI